MFTAYLNQWSNDSVVRALCWTFIHSLWQGLLVSVVAGFALMVTKRSSALLRYNLLTVLFITFLVTTVITFSNQLRPVNSVYPLTKSHPAKAITSVHNLLVPVSAFTSPGRLTEKLGDFMNENASLIVLLWSIFFLVKCARFFTGLIYIRRIRTYKTHNPASNWSKTLEDLRAGLGIKKHIILLQSEIVKIPLTVGYLKPVILFPLGLMADIPVEQVEAILLHELAHIRRKDYLINLVQALAEMIFFFNPLVIWLSAVIREEREVCCDDMVIEYSTNARPYIEALLHFQQNNTVRSGYAMELGGERRNLLERVKRMITRENKKLKGSEKTLLVLGLLAIYTFGVIWKEGKIMAAPKQHSEKAKSKTYHEIPESKTDTPPEEKTTIPKNINSNLDKKERLPENRHEKSELDEMPNMFTNITSNVEDDGQNTTTIIEATDDGGKKYRIKKVENEIKEVSVNGSPVSKEKLDKYEEIADYIQNIQEIRMHKMPPEMEEQFLRTSKIAIHYSQEKKKVMQEKTDLATIQKKLAELDKEAQEKIQAVNEEEKVKAHKAHQIDDIDEQVKSILIDLMREKVITHPEGVSFVLNNKELLVNNKKQSDEIYQNMKEKYIRNSKDFFSYLNKNGTIQTSVHQE